MSICNSVQRRELILSALHKLEDRDTMKTAIEELHTQIQNLDADGLPTVVSSLCRIDRNQKNFARRESVRLFGALAAVDCPSREAFLTSHFLSKSTKFLIHVFSDRDGSVREVAAETFAILAKEWSTFSECLIPGDSQNLFLKRIFKALGDPKREIQSAACDALGLTSDFVAPLHKDLIKEILRFLKNPNFYAKANLLQAVASFDGQPQGILKSSISTFRPFVVCLLGQHGSAHRSSYGLLHLISSPDWFIRKASVDALRAISVLNGSELIQSNKKTILRIRERLQRHRFDRVKPVRDAVLQTIEAYENLTETQREKQDDDLVTVESMSEASGLIPPTEYDDQAIDGLSIVSEQIQTTAVEDVDDQRSDISNFRSISESGCKGIQKKGLANLRRHKSAHQQRTRSGEKQDVTIYLPKTPTAAKRPKSTTAQKQTPGTSAGLKKAPSQNPDLTQVVHGLDQRFGNFSSYMQNEVQKLSASIQNIHQKLLEGPLANSNSRADRLLTSRPSTATSMSKCGISGMQNQDLDVLYQKALSNQIDFFRILQRTGPVISQLSVQTLDPVFEAFCWLLSERRGITRILPWIWQLTEQEYHSIASSIRPELQEKLLQVFCEMREEGIKEQNQIQLLESALRRLWSNSGVLTPDMTVQDDTESLYATSFTTELSPSHDQPY